LRSEPGVHVGHLLRESEEAKSRKVQTDPKFNGGQNLGIKIGASIRCAYVDLQRHSLAIGDGVPRRNPHRKIHTAEHTYGIGDVRKKQRRA
jgi:hypothetical protein